MNAVFLKRQTSELNPYILSWVQAFAISFPGCQVLICSQLIHLIPSVGIFPCSLWGVLHVLILCLRMKQWWGLWGLIHNESFDPSPCILSWRREGLHWHPFKEPHALGWWKGRRRTSCGSKYLSADFESFLRGYLFLGPLHYFSL